MPRLRRPEDVLRQCGSYMISPSSQAIGLMGFLCWAIAVLKGQMWLILWLQKAVLTPFGHPQERSSVGFVVRRSTVELKKLCELYPYQAALYWMKAEQFGRAKSNTQLLLPMYNDELTRESSRSWKYRLKCRRSFVLGEVSATWDRFKHPSRAIGRPHGWATDGQRPRDR